MEQSKWMKLTFLTLASIFIFATMMYGHDLILVNSIRIPFERLILMSNDSHTSVKPTNQSNNSTSIIDSFIPLISKTYPHLPIHMFSHTAPPFDNRTRLILLGNGFFGDRGWGIVSPGKSSTETMTSLFCPFLSNYCDITTNMERFSEADAIVYHIRDSIDRKYADKNRKSSQRIVFALWESPAHTPNLKSYRQFFNWTMTYRFQSDVITSYYSGNPYIDVSSDFYRQMMLEKATRNLSFVVKHVDHRPSKEVLANKTLGIAAALISNCGGTSQRLKIIEQLRKFIKIDVYGRCGLSCPPKRNCREYIAEKYFFILSFENSLCTDYTTEKFFASLEFSVVPVVLGRTNYSSFIPKTGFVDTRDFTTIADLARFLNETSQDQSKYLSFFTWKQNFVWGLNQFFSPFCDLCLRLHLDHQEKTIDDIQSWWSSDVCEQNKLLH